MSDTIYRQAAIDVLDVLCQEHRYRIPGKRETYSQYNEAWQDALGRAECAIGELPSAQPVRKKGKWIEFDSSEDKYDVIKCPCCKHTFTVDSYHWTDIGFIKDDFKFCPNCGADMRGEQDE